MVVEARDFGNVLQDVDAEALIKVMAKSVFRVPASRTVIGCQEILLHLLVDTFRTFPVQCTLSGRRIPYWI